MMIKNKIIVFDLDDTLYKEIDFLQSAYRFISGRIEKLFGVTGLYEKMLLWYEEEKDVFQQVIENYHLPMHKEKLKQMYREHEPIITLDTETEMVLERLGQHPNCTMGIITDGRVVSQMNKIYSLGLLRFIKRDNILISESHGHQKPDEYAFRKMEQMYNGCDYIYVGDNPSKDFLAPNQLGWKTIMLKDDGRNIHKQETVSKEYLPLIIVEKIGMILDVIR